MSFSQLGYPQYLSATQAAYGGDRTGVLSASFRGSPSEIGAGQSATAAVTSVLGMYANPYAAPGYSAFLPYSSADLALFSQLGAQYELKDSPGALPSSFAAHAAAAFYPYGQCQYGDAARVKSATRETTTTLKAWLQEHKKNPYPTKGEKIMLAIITKMTLTQVSTWFANARRRLKKENKVTWGRSAEDRDGKIFDSDNEGTAVKNEDEEIDLESVDIDKIDENNADQSNEEDDGDEDEDDNFDEREGCETTHKRQTQKCTEKPKYTSTEQSIDKNRSIISSDEQSSSQIPPCHKPKIWSLAETATCPDSFQKSAMPPGATSRTSIPIQHPAFLPSHGVYTCQIGKLQNWTSGAFLGQSGLPNVKSVLGLDHGPQAYNLKSPAGQKVTPRSAPCLSALDSESPAEGVSPKHTDQGNVQRTVSPMPSIKPSLQHVRDSSRVQYEKQRLLRPPVLSALTST